MYMHVLQLFNLTVNDAVLLHYKQLLNMDKDN
jgi:hypothetical protein